MSESKLQHEIMRGLRLLGHIVFKMPSGLIQSARGDRIFMGNAGMCDLTIGLRHPTYWEIAFCEVKLPLGKLSYRQILTLKEHQKAGRLWMVADSWDSVDKWLHDPTYHGPEKFTRAILDPSFQYEAPRTRTIVKKPHPLDPVLAEYHKRLERERNDMDKPPF